MNAPSRGLLADVLALLPDAVCTFVPERFPTGYGGRLSRLALPTLGNSAVLRITCRQNDEGRLPRA